MKFDLIIWSSDNCHLTQEDFLILERLERTYSRLRCVTIKILILSNVEVLTTIDGHNDCVSRDQEAGKEENSENRHE